LTLAANGYAHECMVKKPTPTISELFPRLTEEELKEAEENLERYLVLVLRIFERIESEQSTKAGALTPNMGTLTCRPPRSESSASSP